MPIYEYKCGNGHVFDVIQRMTDEPLTECEVCGAPASRVLTPPAIHFKGSGFHNTDYGKKKGAAAGGGDKEAKGADSAPSTDSKKTETKAETKAASASD